MPQKVQCARSAHARVVYCSNTPPPRARTTCEWLSGVARAHAYVVRVGGAPAYDEDRHEQRRGPLGPRPRLRLAATDRGGGAGVLREAILLEVGERLGHFGTEPGGEPRAEDVGRLRHTGATLHRVSACVVLRAECCCRRAMRDEVVVPKKCVWRAISAGRCEKEKMDRLRIDYK